MGIGMQIVYLGFAGSAQIEAEAGAQLVRLFRFASALSGCHLAIELMRANGDRVRYDARLDLITPSHDLKPVRHCTSDDPNTAIRQAFDEAEKQLEHDSAKR
ncbi:HPF/RaiA family ribosome-associated protein [Paraburkholderia kururiensis]|uniref:HPF/RaiA family ribosome-associated protein n=1 Tax=Paraburkholderia kururiensis TaxID=984307 RepID=A0ABZ0WR31_9BURK|nr:HPF/RaiA family ribosome-associated protein [Paraburkholderia kururiensis]WQD79696.1 HPF/RaiA family ribosome-associated protein [Paraburkholderia kururiensis]